MKKYELKVIFNEQQLKDLAEGKVTGIDLKCLEGDIKEVEDETKSEV